MPLAKARGNIKISGLSSWKIKDSDDPGYSALSTLYLRDGKLSLSTVDETDQLAREQPFAYAFEASAKFPVVKTVANLIQLLDTLGSTDVYHKIATRDGMYFNSAATSMPGNFGTKWRLVSDSALDNSMFVEVVANYKLTLAEYAYLIASSASNPADGTPLGTDAYYNLASMTRGDIATAGISKIEIGASQSDDIGVITDSKFEAELLTFPGARGEHVGWGIKVSVDAKGRQASSIERALYDDVAVVSNDWKVTFIGGMTFTTTDDLGIHWELHHDNDADDTSFVRVTGSGIIDPSDWDAMWA